MAVIEELVHRRDNKVRGANVRVVTKGKTLCLSRLYKSFTLSKSGRVLQTCLGVERGRDNAKERCKSVTPCRAVAWKMREMMNKPDD